MTSKKRGLGKGLSALIGEKSILDDIGDDYGKESTDQVQQIPLDNIVAKEDQPRKEFDKSSLKELAESIKVHGVIQPILVRKKEDKYEIIAGERRFRASRLVGLKEIPAIIMDADKEDAAKLALIENIQREDLNPIEEAMAYKHLLEEFRLTQEEVAKTIGKSRSYIANSLRLLNLEEKVIEYLYNGDLTTGHGKVLLAVKDKKQQLSLAEKIVTEGLNVRETEKEVKKLNKKKPSKRTTRERDPYIIDLEEQLMRSLGTKVRLTMGKKNGKIEIEYYGMEDLERILEMLSI